MSAFLDTFSTLLRKYGVVLPVSAFLIVGIYCLLSIFRPIVPVVPWHPSVGMPDSIEVCENVDLDEVKNASAEWPSDKPRALTIAPLCLCDMDMQPLKGKIQVAYGVPPDGDEDDGISRLGLTDYHTTGGLIDSACVYLPDPDQDFEKGKASDLTPKERHGIARHETGHALGIQHPYIWATDGFDEQEPRSLKNWWLPAWFHVMTWSRSFAGPNTRGL